MSYKTEISAIKERLRTHGKTMKSLCIASEITEAMVWRWENSINEPMHSSWVRFNQFADVMAPAGRARRIRS